MKKIAIISDTHWDSWDLGNSHTVALQAALSSGYDQIWHAGDVVNSSILTALEEICLVKCVKGNCDNFMGRNLPHSIIERVEDVLIAMTHGWDLPLDHIPTIVGRFADDVALIIHGHTHRRRCQEFKRADSSSVTVLNPGSVSSPRGGETPAYGELIVDGAKWEYRSLALA